MNNLRWSTRVIWWRKKRWTTCTVKTTHNVWLTVVDTAGLTDDKTVQQLQDEAQLLLSKYVRHVRPDEPSRFGKLLLTVPCVRAASSSAVSDLFFTDTVGAVSVERLVADIYRQMSSYAGKWPTHCQHQFTDPELHWTANWHETFNPLH